MPLFNPAGAISGNLTVTGTSAFTGATTATSVALTGAASTTDIITGRITGDAEPQVVVNANGRIELGGGTTPVDVAFFRDGSTRLHTVNTFVTEGDLQCDVAGGGINIKEGTNATMGVATLVAGTVTVSTTAVTANSRIFLTTEGGTLTNVGSEYIETRTAGTSFVIKSTNALDASNVAWLIVEPA